MPSFKLRTLFASDSHSARAIQSLCSALGAPACVVDNFDRPLMGAVSDLPPSHVRPPSQLSEESVGWVLAEPAEAAAIGELLTHLASRESESRALASEVLHLYREINLIEQLSEDLSALLDVTAVGQRALQETQRLIPATCGAIFLHNKAADAITEVASFSPSHQELGMAAGSLCVQSRFLETVLERGSAEIINNCGSDSRVLDEERHFQSIMCAPLRAGELTSGAVIVANSDPNAFYSSADLKLLNTIPLLAASAFENALLCEEMVDAARERAAPGRLVVGAHQFQQRRQGGSLLPARPVHSFASTALATPATPSLTRSSSLSARRIEAGAT